MVLNTLEELPAHLDPQCLLISNLNRDTREETLFDFFNKIQDVEHVEIDLDKQDRSKGSAIILFVQPLTNYNIILSKVRIDGKLVDMGFAQKGFVSTHSWRETSKRSDHIRVPAAHFSLGTMLASKTFVDLWSYPKDILFSMNFNLRQISIYFRHLDHRYRMDFGFNNINGEMKMERENLSTHLTFTLWCPARTWREKVIQRGQKPQQQSHMINDNNNNNNVRNDYNTSIPSPSASPLRTNRSLNNTNNKNNNIIRATKTTTDRIWERVLDIPLDKNAEILINQENNKRRSKSKRERTPVFPEYLPHRVNLAAWRTYRIKFEPPEHKLKDFEAMLKNAAHYNLISREFNLRRQLPLRVLPASQLPQKPHNHIERARKLKDFDVLYYLECAITQGLIDEINLDDTLYEVLNEIGSTNQQYPRGILKALLEEENSRVWKPYDAISKVFNQKSLKVASSTAVPDHCVLIRKVIVTPTTMYLQPPTLEVTNRVVRHFSAYADRFLRVQFVDEGLTRVAAAFDDETSDAVYSRIYMVLQDGIQIGTRRYDFLAFSSSQLRGHGCWFFAPTRDLSCGMIRSWMGSFSHVKTVAKHAVRMGQCFSTTIPTVQLSENQVELIDDIVHNGYTFSDGVGKISPQLARDVSQNLKLAHVPSCIQFRLGGAKGVLSLSNYLSGRKIQLRPSQIKFESAHTMLEVIRTSEYLPAYLNRQAITLLSTLGIKDQTFMQMTKRMVDSMTNMLGNPTSAIKIVCQNMDEHGNTDIMTRIIDAGFLTRGDPYIINMLNVFRVSKLRDIKEKARIHVPKGAFLLGMLDETDSLEEGEIYVRISDTTTSHSSPSRRKPPIVGPCVIFRNPCFHPGDVRTVMAVDYPKLRHLYDVVVFSAKGFRDLPSMLSGGDLDGDDYTVIWDEALLPTKGNYDPFSYEGKAPLEKDQVEIKDIKKFFVNYINNDNLGQIANSHLAISDESSQGAKDGRCVRLAQLHSAAVDFAKTGRPAEFEDYLRTSRFPDFMQKRDKESYESDKVLGRMFRSINANDYVRYREILLDSTTYDHRLWLDGMAEYIVVAREQQACYNRDLLALMNQCGVHTEAELVSGYVMEWKKKTSANKSMFEQTKQVIKAVKSLQENYRKEFLRTATTTTTTTAKTITIGEDGRRKQEGPVKPESSKHELELKAAAYYYVTYHPQERARLKSDEAGLFSFPWIVYDYICAIAVRNTERRFEQKMLNPIAEHIIDMHRTDLDPRLQVSLAQEESEEEFDDSDDDDDDDDEDDDYDDEEEDDDENENDLNEVGDNNEGIPVLTFKISDLKKKTEQPQQDQQQQPVPDFNVPPGTYINIGANASEEELKQQLLPL